MGWDRQPPVQVQAPTPIVLGRWVLAAVLAMLVGVLLFLLHASERLPQVQALNVWALCGLPLLIWVMAFSGRAYFYGGALSHHQFLEEEALAAQQAWQNWAQRYMAVHASCVLLPDQVSASVLTQGRPDLPPRTGLARRIAALPEQEAQRTHAGLQLLFPALGMTLESLPAQQELRVTLLSDVGPDQYEALRDAWQQSWAIASSRSQPTTVTVTGELSQQWIDDTLKSGSSAFELIVVLQVHGKAAYSDGLAALLLSQDNLARALKLPVLGALSRPMPLQIEKLDSELPPFLQTQTSARQATGLLADSTDWQAQMGKIIAASCTQGAALKTQQSWVQESLCGLPGPFGGWLVAALAVEMVRHQRQPLLVLAKDQSQRWISTVTTGEWA
jgi:hypothetical protein